MLIEILTESLTVPSGYNKYISGVAEKLHILCNVDSQSCLYTLGYIYYLVFLKIFMKGVRSNG